MLTYQGKALKFCSYSDIEAQNPTWVAQTKMDEHMRCLNIWKIEEQYYITIAAV
jgi:hypothetical protein